MTDQEARKKTLLEGMRKSEKRGKMRSNYHMLYEREFGSQPAKSKSQPRSSSTKDGS